jgi:hypothetical protein
VLLAHHRRDQAETWLLQALRGAGAAGLSAMPAVTERGGLIWARPWLDQRPEAIQAYVDRYRIRHVEDPSNQDPRYARSRLRQQVWPVLSQAFPDAEQCLHAAAAHAQEDTQLRTEVAAMDLPALDAAAGLRVADWLLLPPARRALAMRAWLRARLGSTGVPESLVQRLLKQLVGTHAGHWPVPMALIVHKYGGTSMGSTERIRNVAKRVGQMGARRPPDGGRALGDERRDQPPAGPGQGTACPSHTPALRELDMPSPPPASRCRWACWRWRCRPRACPAVSYGGWQVPIRPIRPSPRRASEHRRQPACAPTWPPARWSSSPASRASTSEGNVTTLGRGGSDTSAVAVAAALKADECLIYTDVDGVYTTDPRIVPEARRLHTISFEEMLEMASLGSKVLQIRSVEFAGKYRVPLRVLSSFTPWDIDARRRSRRAP